MLNSHELGGKKGILTYKETKDLYLEANIHTNTPNMKMMKVELFSIMVIGKSSNH